MTDMYTKRWEETGHILTEDQVDTFCRLGISPDTENAHLIVAAYRAGYDAGAQDYEDDLL